MRYTLLSLPLCGLAALAVAQPQPAEQVSVTRVVIDARVVDDDGAPVRGLDADDFDVRIGGMPVEVESAQWIGADAAPPAALPSTSLTGVFQPAVRGRLVVFVVQRSMSAERALGLLRLLQDSDRLLAGLTREDRVAVLTFDSHLAVWLDFTDDLERVREVLTDDVLFRQPPDARQGRGVSLLPALGREIGRDTFEIEDALRLLGDALEPLPGAKSVVLVGYGFGEFTLTLGIPGSRLDPRYEAARSALASARAAVFSLDATNADYHTFEHGLQTVSADTGGFYARTHISSRRALDRVAGALRGHYVLFTSAPELEPGLHEIEVELVETDANVFARSTYGRPE